MADTSFIANVNKIADNLDNLIFLKTLPNDLKAIEDSAISVKLYIEKLKTQIDEVACSIENDFDKIINEHDAIIGDREKASEILNQVIQTGNAIQSKTNIFQELPKYINNAISNANRRLDILVDDTRRLSVNAEAQNKQANKHLQEVRDFSDNILTKLNSKLESINLLYATIEDKTNYNISIINQSKELLDSHTIQQKVSDEELEEVRQNLAEINEIYRLIKLQQQDIEDLVKYADLCVKTCSEIYQRTVLSCEDNLCTFPNISFDDPSQTAIPNINCFYVYTGQAECRGLAKLPDLNNQVGNGTVCDRLKVVFDGVI